MTGRAARLADSGRRIADLAWPVFVGQVAVLAFGTVDTVLVARHAAVDLAALAVGAAAYITVFIGLMGVVLAISPIVGQLFGAGKLAEAGRQTRQALWVVVALSLLGSTLLVFPEPFLALARTAPEVEDKVRGYLLGLAVALPAALLFTLYRGFNTAVSRPKAVMVLQLGGLALKVPLSVLLVAGSPSLGVPAMGVVGCGIATAVAMWVQVAVAMAVMARDPFYRAFELLRHGLEAPHRASLMQFARLGVPMGASVLVEVTAFSFMALFIARLGTTPVAGHQIAVNLVSLMFMMPLAVGSAASTLVAQRVGAGDTVDAARIARHALLIGASLAALFGAGVYLGREPVLGLYTDNAVVLAAALPLMAPLVLFHVADALQIVAAFVLRAFKIATVPMLIYVAALWGVGLGGGYALAFDIFGGTPAVLQGARGFWSAATVGLVIAATALTLFLLHVLRGQLRHAARAVAVTAGDPGAGAGGTAAPQAR